LIQTKYGPFDGDSWEDVFQKIFKKKYLEMGYQEMPASPGDFGIEGFVKSLGMTFQCYCPDKLYTSEVLYEKQRDKITTDLGKLKKYEAQLLERLGSTKIKKWLFITPSVDHNNLLKHAQCKRDEVLSWGLPFIDDDFEVELQDIDFYASEINQIRTVCGEKVSFFEGDISEYVNSEYSDIYSENIARKNAKRCIVDGVFKEDKHKKLNELTINRWLESSRVFKEIEADAANVFYKVSKVISLYEDEVMELCLTWDGKAEDLVKSIKEELALRMKESIPELGPPEIHKISNIMVANWIAHCPLEIE